MRDVREISLKQRAPEGCAREAHGGSLVVHHLPLSHPQTHNASLSFSAQTRRHAAHNYHGGRPHRDAGCRGRRSDRGEPQGHPRGESFGGLAHSLTLSTGTYGPAPLRSLAPPPSRAVPSSRQRGRGAVGQLGWFEEGTKAVPATITRNQTRPDRLFVTSQSGLTVRVHWI